MLDLIDLIDVAVKIEAAGYEFYSKLSKKVDNELSKVFIRLAEQERDHIDTFRSLLEKYRNISPVELSTWANEEVKGYLTSFAQVSIFPKINTNEIPEKIEDALKMAIDVEKDSIIFYDEIEALVPDKTIIDEIIKEEKSHLADLSKLLSELEK
ncbi:MAG TPA: DUF2202 domain-containing protein [Thermotogaceae bacterium]|nr:ferritin family protein [Thermotogota bacterium]HEW93001.1 DUF2202 domain-containing protein [Thermotogaceae bacterium]